MTYIKTHDIAATLGVSEWDLNCELLPIIVDAYVNNGTYDNYAKFTEPKIPGLMSTRDLMVSMDCINKAMKASGTNSKDLENVKKLFQNVKSKERSCFKMSKVKNKHTTTELTRNTENNNYNVIVTDNQNNKKSKIGFIYYDRDTRLYRFRRKNSKYEDVGYFSHLEPTLQALAIAIEHDYKYLDGYFKGDD